MARNISRRSVAAGVAWSLPAVAMATAAPSLAASVTGSLAAGPWYNTWPSADDVNGDHGGYVPYVIMGTTDTSGAASYDPTSPQSSTWDVDGTGAYPCDPTSATYGAGETITVTITETTGTPYGTTPIATSQTAPGPAAWPDLIIRDVGMYSVVGYEDQQATSGALYGALSGDGTTTTWTWVITMLRNNRGCNTDPVTFDLRFRSQGLNQDGSQRLSEYTIVTTSPWGTVTQTIPGE